MKNAVVMCVISGFAGAALAVWLLSPPDLFTSSVAQEPSWGLGAGRPNPAPGTAAPPRWELLSAPPRTDRSPEYPPEEYTPEERVYIDVYERVNRSVVNIDTRSVRTDAFFLFEVPTAGAGSGVVLDQQGHVLTNYHVVEDARAIRVTLFNGKSYEATPVGVDPVGDVAVLKIDAPAETLYPIAFGDSSHLKVGQLALAIGNPFGMERTLSVGVISAVNRQLSERRDAFRQLIQIDADINPGNSGGPLLDSRGRMIGMTTVIASTTGQSAGVGFAIPINTIARVVPDLLERGRVVRPNVGIASVYQTGEGLLIAELTKGGPAEKAGLRGPRLVVRERRQGPFVSVHKYWDRSAADLITHVDGRRVRTADDLLEIVESKRPGDRVTITVQREGRAVDVPVTLTAGE